MDKTASEPRRLKFIYRWILKGKINYYAYFLEPSRSSLSLRLLARRFHWAQIPEPALVKLQELKGKGKLVWAIKHRSRLDFIFLHHLLSEYQLPAPTISLEVPIWLFFSIPDLIRTFFARLVARRNFWEKYLEQFWRETEARFRQGQGMLTYLINPPRLTTRYLHPEQDPFYNLLRWQEESGEDILIVPLVIVFRRAPERTERGLLDIIFGSQDQPGGLRKLYNYLTLTLTEEAILETADPVNLREFLARKDQQGLTRQILAHRLREHLSGHLEREKKVIIGPRFKPRSMLMEEVLQDQNFNRHLEEIAGEGGRRLMEIKREAAGYLEEMAANYNQRAVDFLILVLTIGFRNLFAGIEVDENSFEKIREIAKRFQIVYVPSHKSHIDYLVLGYVLYQKRFFPPHIVAGINMNFFPIGPVFRGGGAFFMRRKFKDNKVYASVFSTYLKILLREGYPIEFFIEGGRSRTGRLLLPRLGIVKYLVNAFQQLGLPDLYFVPVYIGYDQVIEQGEYLQEIKGEKEKGSALFSLLRSWRLIREQYGKIYLNFGKPLSFRNYLEQVSAGHGDEEETGYQELGSNLVNEINRLTLVTPGGLVACALLSSARPARKDEELFIAWRCFYQWVLRKNARLSKTFESIRDWQEEALIFYQAHKLIEINYDEMIDRRIISLPEDKRLSLEFYKNNLIHFFLSAGIVALLRLNPAITRGNDREKLIPEFTRMKKMLRFDFVFPPGQDEEIDASLDYFESEAGMDQEVLKNFAGLIANFLESYLIALRTLLSLRTARITEQNFLERAKKIGAQLYQLREIDRLESISQLNFQNALKWMRAEGWLNLEQDHYRVNPEKISQAEQELNWIRSQLSAVRYF